MCPSFGTESVRRSSHSSSVVDGVCKVVLKLCLLKRTIFLITATLLTVVCQGLPIIAPNRGNLSNSAVSQVVEYLSKYGYLPPSDPDTGNLRTESQLREAIATMQRFGNLEPTGMIDDPTIKLMQRRRCGVQDVAPGGQFRVKRYAIQGQKWPNTNLTWSVKSRDKETDLRMVRSQLRRAFGVWSSASSLTFVEVQEPVADVLVSFLKGSHGDGYPFDGEGSVLAHAFFPGEGIGGDAHFDAEEKWLPSQPEDEDEGVNLFAVAAHEIGHSLGLSHSSTPGSLMFPYYQVMGEHFTLPKDDADGIRHLYGFKDSDVQPTMPTLIPPTMSTIIPPTMSTMIPPTTTQQPTTTKRSKFTTKKATTTFKPQKPTIALKPRKTTKSPVVHFSKPPDVCNTSIDAISVIRRELFVFKGQHFWRLDANRTIRSGYPVTLERFWYDLPTDIEKVDAIYERPIDTKIVFFSGKQFWLFSANQLEPGYPRPLTDLGLPADLERIDAAMVWGHNGKTYFFSGKEYWKFDEMEGRVELDYPRSISSWRGVPSHVDAAFQWIDGNTYFFKENKYWKFVDTKMKIENKGPSEVGGFWFKCPSKTFGITGVVITTQSSRILESEPTNMAVILKLPSVYIYVFLMSWYTFVTKY